MKASEKLENAYCIPSTEAEWQLFGFTDSPGYKVYIRHGVPKVTDPHFNENWTEIPVVELYKAYLQASLDEVYTVPVLEEDWTQLMNMISEGGRHFGSEQSLHMHCVKTAETHFTVFDGKVVPSVHEPHRRKVSIDEFTRLYRKLKPLA